MPFLPASPLQLPYLYIGHQLENCFVKLYYRVTWFFWRCCLKQDFLILSWTVRQRDQSTAHFPDLNFLSHKLPWTSAGTISHTSHNTNTWVLSKDTHDRIQCLVSIFPKGPNLKGTHWQLSASAWRWFMRSVYHTANHISVPSGLGYRLFIFGVYPANCL